MNKKRINTVDFVQILSDFQKHVENSSPSQKEMYEEIQLMQFKIRPLQGDVSQINIADIDFIEVLWRLGKLEELFHREFHKLSYKQQEIFFDHFDKVYQKYQDKLNNLNLVKKVKSKNRRSPVIEMEIFKDSKAIN